jgi:membrane protease YdiL (CAAX protease family)
MIKMFTNWVKHNPIVAYFVLVFSIEWFLLLMLSTIVPPMIALLIGSWLPNGVGLFITGVADGRAGLHELFRRVVLWRISLKWYLIAFFLPIAMPFLAIGIFALFGQEVPNFAPASQLLTIVIISIFTGALGEELGWRGTALPRLQARWNALISSIILGILWGLYHLPSFLLSGLPLQNAPLIPFMLAALGITILVTWTFNRSSGSLIPVFLYHFAFNFIVNATGILGNPVLFWLLSGIIIFVAFTVIALEWTRFTRHNIPSTEGFLDSPMIIIDNAHITGSPNPTSKEG